ncbi:hypothetical protein ES703_18947 [subsurface metagenome]
MRLKEILRTIAKYYITAALVTAFIAFEAEGIPYSNLFVAVLTACLGTTGIMVYGDIKRCK